VNTLKGFEESEPEIDDSLNTLYSLSLAQKNNTEAREQCDLNGAPGWNYLKHIQEVCKKNNIILVCYTSPYYGVKCNKESAQKTKEELTREGIIYFNFNESEIPSLASPYLWKDYSHLNSKGARKFSVILNDSLKATGLY
jgi:lysophospholipase L1-like esterase